jgi:hypothetical protein
MKRPPHFALALTLLACSSPDSAIDPFPVDVNCRSSLGRCEPPLPPSTRPADPPPRFPMQTDAQKSPPPLSGGTLAIDGNLAIAADSDRDRVSFVDLKAGTTTHVALSPGDEPGRIAVEPGVRAHVVLRRAGAIATYDLVTKTLVRRTSVCRVPRGIAFDAKTTHLYVVCAEGELVTLDPTSGVAIAKTTIEEDSRDVVIGRDGDLFLSEFRSGKVTRYLIATMNNGGSALTVDRPFQTRVTWRMIAAPGGLQPMMVSQEMTDPSSAPTTGRSNYGNSDQSSDACSHGVVNTNVQIPGQGSVSLAQAVLPLDIATAGSEISVIGAGNAHTPGLAQVFTVPSSAVRSQTRTSGPRACQAPEGRLIAGQAIALAYASPDLLVVQSREPAALHLLSYTREAPKVIALGGESVEDVGHAVFHSNSGGRVACASCHAEGGDDGRVWSFPEDGIRRTPSLLGTVKGTAPYHWAGDQANIRALTTAIYQGRMQGPELSQEVPRLQSWLESLPAPIAYAPADTAEAIRGKAHFEARCASCHAGPMLTNNSAYAVRGDAVRLQVPSLVGLSVRAPYMHDGCAPTIGARLLPLQSCGGLNHGDLSNLDVSAKGDLVAYLRSL